MTDKGTRAATLKQTVLSAIDARQEEAVALLRELIRIPSPNPPGDEKRVANYCSAYLRNLGLSVDEYEPAVNRVSNIARVAGTTHKPVLLFNSHLDTFNPGDLENWKYPPFDARVVDGTIWGIGAKNMKAGLAASMFVVKILRDMEIPLRGDLLVCQTADEMAFGHWGLEQIVAQGLLQADYAVYTESDPPVKIEISHRGMVWIEIRVKGLGKHTKLKGVDTPDGRPVNAIWKMAGIIEALESMEFSGWEPDAHIPGPPIISVNYIQGGQAGNMIADNCTIQCDCRTLPSQTTAGVMADVERVLGGLRDKDPSLRVTASVLREGPASAISPTEPIVIALQDAIREVTGQEMPIGGVSSISDARWLTLNAGIPTAKFEFQDSESGPNEHMSIEDYLNTIRVYAVLAINLLG